MSKDYEITVDAHPNIYNKSSERSLNIFFSEPECGIKNDTGIMIIIPGFGGNANTNVYKKMRTVFADQFNLVTIQCDYFGLDFMQSDLLEETIDNFNDMGPLQAMDIIGSVVIIEEIIKDNNLTYDANKIIAYGHSHGAYLAYLANAFAPNLFSLIIDNSSWLIPVYLSNRRKLITEEQIRIFDYYVRELEDLDLEIYDLRKLYKNLDSNCHICSFHGDEDNLISVRDKQQFILPINNSVLHIITKEKINDIFRSNTHGLEADFFKMFEFVISELKPEMRKNKRLRVSHGIETSKYVYLIDFENTLPVLERRMLRRK